MLKRRRRSSKRIAGTWINKEKERTLKKGLRKRKESIKG